MITEPNPGPGREHALRAQPPVIQEPSISPGVVSIPIYTHQEPVRTSAPCPSALVFDVVMTDNNQYEIVGSSPACSPCELSFEADDSLATVEGDDIDEVEDKAVYEQHPELRDLEMIDDNNELAHNLWNSGLYPHAHPRIEALFRRAAAGKGEYSRRLAASGMI
jgi:hypothetical protein